MQALFWHLANRSAETQFILSLVQLLLAGLTLLVLLHQLRAARKGTIPAADWLLPLGMVLLVSHFALHALYFGIGFFFHKEFEWAGIERFVHGLRTCGFLVIVAACLDAPRAEDTQLARWILAGCSGLAVVLVLDIVLSWPPLALRERSHSLAMLVSDALVLLSAGIGMRAVFKLRSEGWQAYRVAMASLGVTLLLHVGVLFLSRQSGILAWNAEQHVLSVALFALAWAAGERSRDLLDRIFVRLNLTFIVLASLILLATAAMQKYQYLRLAEERSMNLAEFLRGHVVYYQARGETLEDMFRRPEVLRRVVVELGTLPELREVDVSLDGRRASFRYTPDGEIKEQIVSLGERDSAERGPELPNSFQMISLPIKSGTDPSGRVECLGTMDYINTYIGKYIILIYSLFTLMVGLATGIIGIIVTDTDRRLRRQYAELQETQQQLAQAAKLASIGQLAGGMAHEINTPMTSILSLASHLAEGRSATTLTPEQRNSLQVIARQAERVSKIVGGLLTFSRQSRLEVSRVDVGELLETAVTLLQYRLKAGTIHLRREIDDDLSLVLADAGRLTEVFVNLLNNAIDSMPSGGTLVVRAFVNPDPPGGVRVEVSDTGCGIPPEDLPRIFDPFFTTKQPGRGTGLGLSISHGIVKDHGGEIWAQSTVGAGTTLVVTFPKGGGLR